MQTQQACPDPEAHVTDEHRQAELERLHDVIHTAGFEIIPLPITGMDIAWQLQRGDRIYDRFVVSHMATLLTEPKIRTDLRRLKQFAEVAQANPAPRD